MAGFTKLFNSILMSSVWDESTESRIVWVTLLALADQHGHVDGTVNSLARVARVPVPACQKALDTFLGPDPMDRSGVDDGRRIRHEQGGWLIINHALYRDRMNADERRDRDRLRKRNTRLSARRPQTSETVRVSPVVSELVRDFQHTEAEADQKQIRSEAKNNVRTPPIQKQNCLSTEVADASDPPMDVWFRELVGAYPPSAVSSGHLTEQAFFAAVVSQGSPAVTFTVMLGNLENQKRGHQWRVKGMVPRLDRWLKDGLWKQVHDAEPPAAEQVSARTMRMLGSV